MLSATRGLAWEFVKFGWLHLLLSFVGALGLPILILMTLKIKGAIVVEDPEMIFIHMIFLYISGMLFACALFFVLGKPGRLFCLPLSSRAIALSQMIPTFLVVAIETLLYSAILNRVVGLDWPAVGPAMFLGTAAVTFQAAVYFTHRSLWVIPVTCSLLVAECLWFNTRHGPLAGIPTHYWNDVTPIEWATMIAALAGSLVLGCVGMALNRCGESINTRKFEAWVIGLFETTPGGFPVFSNASSAQFWFEWRQKGLFLPCAVLVLAFGGTFVWLIADRDVANLHYVFFIGGYILGMLGFIAGLLFGKFSPQDSHDEIGHFLASRPWTNKKMAGKTIQVALVSLASAWVLWAAGFALLHFLMMGLGIPPSGMFLENRRSWYLPATVILPWIALGTAMLMTISGRGTRFFQVAISGYIFWLVGTVALTYLGDPFWSRLFSSGCALVCGIALLSWTIWLFLEALKKQYLGIRELFLALAAFALLAVIASLGMAPRSWTDGPGLILILGAMALAVAPFAGAPLALGWNRTR